MPEHTKIIPFPSRAKPRVLSPKPRMVEFAALSKIILGKRADNTIDRLAFAARTADGVAPNVLIWPPNRRS